MHVGENKQVTLLSQNRPGPRMGMGHYERMLVTALSQAKIEGLFFNAVFDGRGRGPVELDDLACGLIDCARGLGFSTRRLCRLPWLLARQLVGRAIGKTDLFHSLALGFPAPCSAPAVYTVHDLPPAHFEDEGDVPRWAAKAAQSAAYILTPSEFARRDLIELLNLDPARVVSIPYGAEHHKFHPGIAPLPKDKLVQLGLTRPYFLYVGGATRRKNVAAMLRAWASLGHRTEGMTLGLVGPEAGLSRLLEDNPAEGVRVIGYVDHSMLPGLLKGAEALVFPSIYEGFGLPPLEAMGLGVPVIGVNASAVREVVGDAGLLAETGDSDALRETLRRFLEQPELKQELSTRGPIRAADFSWQRHAERVLAVYRDVLGISSVSDLPGYVDNTVLIGTDTRS